MKSSSAAGRPRVVTSSNHEASTAAARVVDNFQPVSSETNTRARSSNARTRRATTRSCGTMRIRFLPSCSQLMMVWAADCASSSKCLAGLSCKLNVGDELLDSTNDCLVVSHSSGQARCNDNGKNWFDQSNPSTVTG